MALFKDLKNLHKELEYWNNFKPVNYLGKWYRMIRIAKTKSKIQDLKDEIKRRKNCKSKKKFLPLV